MSNTSLRNRRLPLKVGITGGIGSGKTLACRIFTTLGIPVFNADRAARDLYTSHEGVRDEMVRMFGPEIYLPGGEIHRSLLASLIFNNPRALEAVNRRIHPLVREAFAGWFVTQTGPYVLFESALLFETGTWKSMDLTLLVTAPEELRIHRVTRRDRVSPAEVTARMNHQWKDVQKKELASYILLNDEAHPLLDQILDTDQKTRKIWEISANG
ncbi:MAG: dephospho-CoA kinase [Bacteroidales bacterium]|nr:dephospho-CoA kinase [Bacteroidales bacterium]